MEKNCANINRGSMELIIHLPAAIWMFMAQQTLGGGEGGRLGAGSLHSMWMDP